jgi:alpha-tubulin suppressor-like RCC1 family protein
MLGKGDYFSTRRDKPSSIFQATTNWADTTTTNPEDLYTISSGYGFSSAIKTDGTLWIWGNGNYGTLGNAVTTGNISTPVTTFAGGTNWRQVSCGRIYTTAIKTDGTLWTWGSATNGRLGNAVITGNISTPVTTFSGGTNWKQVSAGNQHVVAIKTDGTLWTWGTGANGRLGNANTTNRSTPVTTFTGGTDWKQSFAIFTATFAIKTDGTLWSWGSGSYGQLGNGVTTGTISTPITTFAGGINWKQIGGGISTGTPVAIKTDGTLWAWGIGGQGSIGNGIDFGNVSTPVTTFAGGTDWKQVTNGRNSTLAIKTDGTLWTWGYGSRGQLGNGVQRTTTSTPVTTFAGGTDWKQVSGGFDHNITLKGTSPNLQIFSFGSSPFGQMGDGFNIQTNYAPGQVFGNSTNWKKVSAGYHNTAAIKTDGTLWVWGYNFGNLGVGDLNDRNTPVTTFAGGTNWKQVITGGYYNDWMRMFAIKTDGTLWSWGSQRRGSLANFVDSIDHVSTPITTFAGGTNWKYVDVGPQVTSAIKTDGTLWTWGAGFNSQLGNANTTDRSTPVTTFAGGTNWKQVGSGGYHVAAIQSGISAEYPLS